MPRSMSDTMLTRVCNQPDPFQTRQLCHGRLDASCRTGRNPTTAVVYTTGTPHRHVCRAPMVPFERQTRARTRPEPFVAASNAFSPTNTTELPLTTPHTALLVRDAARSIAAIDPNQKIKKLCETAEGTSSYPRFTASLLTISQIPRSERPLSHRIKPHPLPLTSSDRPGSSCADPRRSRIASKSPFHGAPRRDRGFPPNTRSPRPLDDLQRYLQPRTHRSARLVPPSHAASTSPTSSSPRPTPPREPPYLAQYPPNRKQTQCVISRRTRRIEPVAARVDPGGSRNRSFERFHCISRRPANLTDSPAHPSTADGRRTHKARHNVP